MKITTQSTIIIRKGCLKICIKSKVEIKTLDKAQLTWQIQVVLIALINSQFLKRKKLIINLIKGYFHLLKKDSNLIKENLFNDYIYYISSY